MSQSMGDGGNRLAFFTCLYLCLPALIFVWGWFTPWLSLPLLALLIAAIYKGAKSSFSKGKLPHNNSSVANAAAWWYAPVLFAVALCWVLTSAAGGLFDQANGDWLKHSTIFVDLARHPWPVLYPQLDEEFQLLRYYIGWYLPPALVAKLFGIAFLSPAILLWTTLGVWLLLLWFTRAFAGSFVRVTAATTLLIFFSGMDILRLLWFGDPLVNDTGLHPAGSYTHLEWRVDRLLLQYSSHTTALLWVPQHFLPAALLVSLLGRRLTGLTGLAFASSVLWSPFASLGVLPLLLVYLGREWQLRRECVLTLVNMVLAPTLVVLIAVYLVAGSLGQPSAWLWDAHGAAASAQLWWVFLFCEVGVLALLLVSAQRQLLRSPMFICALLVLALLPLFSYGRFNDFGMRASLPALFYLSVVTAQVLFAAETRRWSVALLVLVLCVGAITPLAEFNRARNFPLGPKGPVAELFAQHYGFSTAQQSMADLQPFEWLKQYFGNAEEGVYARIRRR